MLRQIRKVSQNLRRLLIDCNYVRLVILNKQINSIKQEHRETSENNLKNINAQ